jgi:acetyl esterase/lipase
VWPGMWHVWQLFAPYLPEANKALESIGAFVGKHT